jgi:hypothetical protein
VGNKKKRALFSAILLFMELPQKQKINFAEFDSGKGREIHGLHPTDERFSLLTEGADYVIDRTNKDLRIVTPGVQIQDFVYFINPGEGEIQMRRGFFAILEGR